jgi:hypothetical protein
MKNVIATAAAALALASLAGAASAATMHSGSWYALADANYQCYAANRPAGPSEQRLAGPFRTEADASKAIGSVVACSDIWNGD